ncbi:translation initiation factor IF-2-like isoform X1 [Mustela erminea]|uniref:translation initiation factor IF-2-like isoform X1 n=1 Tax=Mustela erminea TaxID=36723 RepID=UPI0013866006|nr:translation initiation factor IF-2-like isoform X1 [Mustela erminea]
MGLGLRRWARDGDREEAWDGETGGWDGAPRLSPPRAPAGGSPRRRASPSNARLRTGSSHPLAPSGPVPLTGAVLCGRVPVTAARGGLRHRSPGGSPSPQPGGVPVTAARGVPVTAARGGPRHRSPRRVPVTAARGGPRHRSPRGSPSPQPGGVPVTAARGGPRHRSPRRVPVTAARAGSPSPQPAHLAALSRGSDPASRGPSHCTRRAPCFSFLEWTKAAGPARAPRPIAAPARWLVLSVPACRRRELRRPGRRGVWTTSRETRFSSVCVTGPAFQIRTHFPFGFGILPLRRAAGLYFSVSAPCPPERKVWVISCPVPQCLLMRLHFPCTQVSLPFWARPFEKRTRVCPVLRFLSTTLPARAL